MYINLCMYRYQYNKISLGKQILNKFPPEQLTKMSKIHDCVPCLIRPIFKLGVPLTHYTKIRCIHKEQVREPYLKAETSLSIAVLVLFTTSLSAYLLSIRISTSSSFKETYYSCVSAGLIIYMFMESLSFYLYKNYHYKYLNGLISAVDHSEYFSLAVLINEKNTISLIKYAFIYVKCSIFYCISFGIYRFCLDMSVLNLIIQTGVVITDFIWQYVLVYPGLLTFIYHFIFTSIADHIKKTLITNLSTRNKSGPSNILKLSKIIHLYLLLKNIYSKTVTSLGCLVIYAIGYFVVIISMVTFGIFLSRVEFESIHDVFILFDFTIRYHVFLKILDTIFVTVANNTLFLVSFWYMDFA